MTECSDCTPSKCPNGKCRATNRCIDQGELSFLYAEEPRPRRTLIAFTGLAGSGKTTAAKYLCVRHGFERVRFAGPLKDMVRALGLSEREVDGGLKDKPCALLGGKTPRHAMQTLGTEWGRDLVHPDLWVKAWRTAVDRFALAVPIVVDDCRFPNEVEAVRSAGGILVKVERPGVNATPAGHQSEGQDLGLVVATLRNTGTVADLGARVDALLRSRE